MIPILAHIDYLRRHLTATVEYRPGVKLDIYQPVSQPFIPNRPVLMFIPGGAWLVGSRKGQGSALIAHLVEQGWICVAIDYRTAPQHRWPAPFEDVTAAWNWVRKNIARYGGGDFIGLAGASAGGHMASLLGVTDHSIDRPDCVIPFYGVYSWDSHRPDHWLINRFVETMISDREHLRDASPIHHVHDSVPPFLIIHGDRDFITPESGAKAFHRKLPDSQYYSVRGGHHGFDVINAQQTAGALARIDTFLEEQLVDFDVAS